MLASTAFIRSERLKMREAHMTKAKKIEGEFSEELVGMGVF